MVNKECEKDLLLVSGFFLENYIPNDKFWMTHYFKTKIKFKFLIYYLKFRSHFYFSRHTGIYCTSRYLKYLKNIFHRVEKAHENAKKNFDLDLLSLIESGKYKFKQR